MKFFTKGLCMILLISCIFYLGSKSSAQSSLLSMIEVNFCNNEQTGKELDLVTKGSDIQPICVEYTNKSAAAITINTEFLDSVITSDSIKSRACNAADRPKKQFGNFMVSYTGEIPLPPKQTIQKRYDITYPIGFSGLSHGCLAYYIIGSDIVDNNMFTVRIRSTKYIDIFVTSDIPVAQIISLSQSPILTKIDNEYIISFGIENKGNVEEKIHITSILSSILGYQKDFTFDTIIPANTGVILTTPSFILPVYGGPFRFKNKISYTPQFNFNIINGSDPSQIYVGGIKKTQTLFFVWTRQSWAVIILILLIILGIFRSGPRKEIIKKSQVDEQPRI